MYAALGVLILTFIMSSHLKTATPPPASPSPVPAPPNGTTSTSPPTHTGPPTLSIAQWRFCSSTVRTLRKLKDAGPFLNPVDHVALNIPHYPNIIKNPMDFSTIDRKLNSSNPTKPDSNSANPRYNHADEFIADVRQIFANCVTFNGPDHPITAMGKRVETVFDKQIKQMPVPEEVCVISIRTTRPLLFSTLPCRSSRFPLRSHLHPLHHPKSRENVLS